MTLPSVPFQVRHELPGWTLVWLRLRLQSGAEERLADLRREVAEVARANFEGEGLSSHPTVAAVRALFRAAGCDPTRYRPSSEALLRRLLKGEELPVIHPFVDLNNCLSVGLAVPCCAAAEGTFAEPVTLRAGRPGETFESLRGPFNLEGKPLLADPQGVFGSPITDSLRVKVNEGTDRVWMIAYLPQGTVDPGDARARLGELLAKAPVAEVEAAGISS
jgi:DNA/RNA-binding domain of Phe-tRNA-synthetase-like protein